MILGMEIGLAIFGILALVRGKMTISKTKVVVGAPARLLGLFALTPLPLAFMAGVIYAVREGGGNPQGFVANDNARLTLALIEGGIVVGVAIVVFAIGAMIAVPPQEAERRERTEYDEDEDAERRVRRRREDDEDERDERDTKRRPWER